LNLECRLTRIDLRGLDLDGVESHDAV
jgi:hypothetical protein